MLSLVNYGSSGESDDEENSENVSNTPIQQTTRSSENSSENESDKINDAEWNCDANQGKIAKVTSSEELVKNSTKESTVDNISTKLPPPISDLRSIPWDQLSKLTYKSRAIRIMAPSIPEEIEEKKEKKQPSKTGSGLLAMLPKPKNEFIAKPNSLKPTSVTNKLNPPTKPKLIPKPKLTPSANNKKVEVQSDSEEEDGETDFFSLSKPDSPVKYSDLPLTNDISIPPAIDSSYVPQESTIPDTIPLPNERDSNQSSNNSYFIDTSISDNQTVQSSSYNYMQFQQPNDSLNLDKEALAALCGTRGIKRRAKNDDFKIIDINGSELTPDSEELLSKNLTSDQPRVSHKKSKDGPTSQQKRKHQIMYLAHQAKEQELELQNTWANNRMTKKQTQAKYGF